jgi:hypothetical protein
MKFDYTKGNLKNLGKDAKDLGKAAAHLFKDTFKIPLSIGKDIKYAHAKSIEVRDLAKLVRQGKATVIIKEEPETATET